MFIGPAIRVASTAWKAYQKLDPQKYLIRKQFPMKYRRPAEVIGDIALGGGLLYESYNIIKDVTEKRAPKKTRQIRKRGTYMVKPRGGFKRYNRNPYCNCRRQPYRRR